MLEQLPGLKIYSSWACKTIFLKDQFPNTNPKMDDVWSVNSRNWTLTLLNVFIAFLSPCM